MDARAFPDDITMLKTWLSAWALDAASGLACTPNSLADANARLARIEQRIADTAEAIKRSEKFQTYMENRS